MNRKVADKAKSRRQKKSLKKVKIASQKKRYRREAKKNRHLTLSNGSINFVTETLKEGKPFCDDD